MKKRLLSALLAFIFIPACIPAAYAEESNADVIYTFLTDYMGLNSAAACGVLANIERESGFRPDALGDGGTSYGICQWHNSRWDRLKQFCNDNGYSWETLEGQLWYLKYELEKYYPTILEYIKSVANTADGAYDSGYYWCKWFERPADTENMSVKRGNLAKSKYWPLYTATYSGVESGRYRIKNKATGKNLCIRDGIDSNGQNAELTASAGSSAGKSTASAGACIC